MFVCLSCLHVNELHSFQMSTETKRGLQILELERVKSHHVKGRNWILIHCKINNSFQMFTNASPRHLIWNFNCVGKSSRTIKGIAFSPSVQRSTGNLMTSAPVNIMIGSLNTESQGKENRVPWKMNISFFVLDCFSFILKFFFVVVWLNFLIQYF